MFRNLKPVGRILYGRNSFNQLGDVLAELRTGKESYVLFLVDEYFEGKDFLTRIPTQPQDILKIIDITDEPKTKTVDQMVAEIKALGKRVACICRGYWRWQCDGLRESDPTHVYQ